VSAAVVVVVNDLMFEPRITDAVRALGMEARVADTAGAAEAALAASPALAIIDLQASGIEAPVVVRAAKAAGAAVLAFGRHTDAAALRAAREAGADTVVARSQLVEELRALIEALVEPATG
jgi:DNA-binding response OmpR family regulator